MTVISLETEFSQRLAIDRALSSSNVKVAGGINTSSLQLAVPYLPGRTAADVGSGSGRVLEVLRSHGFVVVGCELDAELAGSSGVEHADAFEWSPPALVDVVTCLEVIEHVPQARHREMIEHLVGWLREDGRLVISTPQRNSPVSLFERAFHRLRPKHGRYCWWDQAHISIMGRRYWEHLFGVLDLKIERCIGCGFVPEVGAMLVPPVKQLRTLATDGPLAPLGFDLMWVLSKS